MPIKNFSEDKLNLFVDEQLDTDEMDEIRKAVLDDKDLRERVCQIKAVQELVGYAYTVVPQVSDKTITTKRSTMFITRAMAASVTLIVGVLLGWATYEYSPGEVNAISAENTFQYVANHVTANHSQRRIILHIDSGDLRVVNAALNEADLLLATYRKANIPIKLDVITNKKGINILRPGMSPYIQRIQALIDDDRVSVYACVRSTEKARKKEGAEVIFIRGVKSDKTARELIPNRLEKGWVYIKA